MPRKRYRIWGVIGIGLSLLLVAMSLRSPSSDSVPLRSLELEPSPSPATEANDRQRAAIALALDRPLSLLQFPGEVSLNDSTSLEPFRVSYTLDWDAQEFIEKQIKAYKPDYAAFVAIDAITGRILTLTFYTRAANTFGNLAVRANYPAASIFKIVTATAAIDQHRANPDTVIAYNGANHTLYRRNVIKNEVNRWTRHISLSEAFAKSVNSVFAKLGLYFLQPVQLKEYAGRFRFNEPIPCDFTIETSRFILPDNDDWAVAEAASGFNRIATLSPVQGALMAAAVANDGQMPAPFLVDALLDKASEVRYRAIPRSLGEVMVPASAAAMRTLMQETIRAGTSRKAFRKARTSRLAEVELGGKTGSLQGDSPKGKYDWFVGYAVGRGRKLAVAALTINEENWRVKSSVLAKSYFEHVYSAR